jgi:hypothetical protein
MTDDRVEFFSLYPGTKAPVPASRDLGGSMQARAARLCSPFTEATGFGWYLYPPVDFAIRWSNDSSEWCLVEDNEPTRWRSLTGGVNGRLPQSDAIIAEARRSGVEGLDVFDKYGGLPFIEADPRSPDMLEVIPGLFARTPPGWSLLLRAVPNENKPVAHQILEGIIETDWYRAYIPVMIRLLRRDVIVRFHSHRPIMAAQPIPATALDLAHQPVVFTSGIEAMPKERWEEFVNWRRLKQDPDSAAQYVSLQKRRRRTERQAK